MAQRKKSTSTNDKRLQREEGILTVVVLALAGMIGFFIVNTVAFHGPAVRSVQRRPALVASRTLHAAAPAQGAGERQGGAGCADRRDNDGDGKVDYPEDEGCNGPDDASEKFSCDDGADNDGDGKVDGMDPECASDADDTEDAREECRDGRDNDYDQKTDYPGDEGCDSPRDPTEGYACNDDADNDGDGKVDSKDPGCSSDADDTEDVVDTCADSRDNDGDGLTDFPQDDGCDSVTDPRED